MRTNNDWRVIEPIMKSGNIGELWEMVVIAQNIQVWNPDSLFLTLGSVKRQMAPIQAPIQGPGFQNWTVWTTPTFLHNSLMFFQFQNGFNDLLVIISSHFLIENIRLTWSQFLSIFTISVHFQSPTFNLHLPLSLKKCVLNLDFLLKYFGLYPKYHYQVTSNVATYFGQTDVKYKVSFSLNHNVQTEQNNRNYVFYKKLHEYFEWWF